MGLEISLLELFPIVSFYPENVAIYTSSVFFLSTSTEGYVPVPMIINIPIITYMNPTKQPTVEDKPFRYHEMLPIRSVEGYQMSFHNHLGANLKPIKERLSVDMAHWNYMVGIANHSHRSLAWSFHPKTVNKSSFQENPQHSSSIYLSVSDKQSEPGTTASSSPIQSPKLN